MTERSKTATAMTWLRIRRGGLADLINSIKLDPSDPRNADLGRAEGILARMDQCIRNRDFIGAHNVTFWLDRIVFKLRAMEVRPLIDKGRTFAESRKGVNEITQLIDDALREQGASATAESVLCSIRKSAFVEHVDSDGSVEWIDKSGRSHILTKKAFDNRVSQRRKKL